jgi:DNA-directed RNA polymerase specialized sigma24 family protein
MTDETKLLESIDRRLKMLVRLDVESKINEFDTNKKKVRALHGWGFDTNEIADIIGTTPASVRAAKSNLREAGEIDE